jgi:hypothetical protein
MPDACFEVVETDGRWAVARDGDDTAWLFTGEAEAVRAATDAARQQFSRTRAPCVVRVQRADGSQEEQCVAGDASASG